ncbi:rapid alkalinization factor-like [Zingiber officinale]|uniref:rapid alkalinization factor-like n=1 Tax=Zingiber officinale TaxID=94328 RepID=UPI001C4CB26D|nr:rapid alkalinization factor-like [Zingiber officinale]
MSLPLKYVLLLLLLAPTVLLAAESEAALDAAARTCSGGECAGGGEEEEAAMPTESSRRALAATRYVSYDALKKDRVPCNQRGQSYYNCQQHGKANPYRRGCTIITRCARMLN